VDRYLKANAVETEDLWQTVISLRITLTLIPTDCDCDNESIDCEKQFTTTVALRNNGSSILASN
jgi:hypothetical protein